MISRVLEAVVLGLTQGVTEFLPISSSGHLVLVPWLLGWPAPSVAFDLVLHLGTLAAVLSYFRKEFVDILRGFIGAIGGMQLNSQEAVLGWLILWATIPGALAGYLFGGFFESLFGEPFKVGLALVLTALFLLGSERFSRRERMLESLGWVDGLLIGLAQALAIAPGISRSGWTIGTALFRHVDRRAAARFSFLLAVPVTLGASLSRGQEMLTLGNNTHWPVLVAGFLTALISGYLAIKYFLKYLGEHGLVAFAVYCGIAGVFTMVLSVVL